MRIALAQINATVGDFAGNLESIRRAARTAREASLVVFPELVVCGYMPRDLLEEDSFLDACARSLEALATMRDLPPLLVGSPLRAQDGPGKPLLNAAVLIRDGGFEVVAKRLLPTYDVFDEHRYFRPGPPARPIVVDGVPIGVTICEDAWARVDTLYAGDPVAELVAGGAKVLVNISASPYAQGKPAFRRELIADHARRHGVPFLYCNLVGANDQLIFDGASFAVDASGALCAQAAFCAEDVLVTDFAGTAEAATDDVKDALLLGIRDYFRKTGFQDAILGLSGGVDSSLTACLAAEALGADHVTGVAMPGPYNAPHSLDDASALAETLGLRFLTLPIGEMFELARTRLQDAWGEPEFGLPEENMQARVRGFFLMALANRENALVLVPSNKSEFAMGYCTLYGDMVGALAPLSDLYKGEVYALARRYPIPERVLTRAPSAELAPNQTDQDSLPPYEVLDAILKAHLEERLRPADIVARGFDEATVHRVLKRVSVQEYKRQQAA
ncbi:MAG: NAD+ synthase, partial [Planctomycetota bacterium]|nr:NAD+ synthase [Planctomycetota bacterium]